MVLGFMKEMQIIKREGVFLKWGGEVSVLLLATWPAMGERERKRDGSEWKLVEVCGEEK